MNVPEILLKQFVHLPGYHSVAFCRPVSGRQGDSLKLDCKYHFARTHDKTKVNVLTSASEM